MADSGAGQGRLATRVPGAYDNHIEFDRIGTQEDTEGRMFHVKHGVVLKEKNRIRHLLYINKYLDCQAFYMAFRRAQIERKPPLSGLGWDSNLFYNYSNYLYIFWREASLFADNRTFVGLSIDQRFRSYRKAN